MKLLSSLSNSRHHLVLLYEPRTAKESVIGMRTEVENHVCYSLNLMTRDDSLPLVGKPLVVPPFNSAYANDSRPSSSSASHPSQAQSK